MATSNVAIYPQKIQSWAQTIANADGTTIKTLLSAGANGSIVESLNLASSDGTLAHSFVLYLNNGSTNMQLAVVNVPINAGNVATVASVDMLRSGFLLGLPVDANGNAVIYVPSGWSLNMQVTVTMTAATTLYAVAMGADY